MTELWSVEQIKERLSQADAFLLHADGVFAAMAEMKEEGDWMLATFEQTIARLTGDLTRLANDLIARDATIANLTESIAVRDGEIYLLVNKVAALDAEIADLETQLAIALRPDADVYVTVGATPYATSKFRTAMQDVDSGLRVGSQAARDKLAAMVDVIATHTMNFGSPDLWPKESDGKPTNWLRLDQRMQTFAAMGVEPAMILYNWPVWLRETVSDAGVATPVPLIDPFVTEGRPMLSKYNQVDTYVYEIAKRYLPYGAKVWVHGNELKGFWGRRDGVKGYAVEEYVALYDRFVVQVTRAATELGIDPTALQFWGCYSAVRTEGTRNSDTVATTHPLFGRPYGEFRKRPLEAIEYFIKNAKRFDGVCFDAGLGNPEGGTLVDAFAATQKWVDLMTWLRTLTNKPVLIAELYDQAFDDGNASIQRTCAVKAVSTLTLIEAGYSGAWLWGGIGQGQPTPPNGGLLTSYAADHQELPWYDVYQTIGEHFSAGAQLYPVTIEGEGVYAKAVGNVGVVVNMTGDARSVCVGDTVHELAGYQVLKVDR
jgi:sulfur transfer complex TusBCD TusB component (DsrH family)